jgi:TatD DNase family protein
MLFDTHCHLNDAQFEEDVEDVIRRAIAVGVMNIVIPGVDVASSKKAIALAETHEGIYAAVGVHPESLLDLPGDTLETIRALTKHPKVVAIGEIGLDYHWDVAPREYQQEVFRQQIQMARDVGLPILIHNRDATEDTVRIIEHDCGGVIGVMHCFTGSFETAKRCIAQGFYISFGGPVTFKNAENVRDVAKQIPNDALLVETDAPYLAPHPNRGTRNEPAHVSLVAQKLAEVRGQSIEVLAHMTRQNALRLFPNIRC